MSQRVSYGCTALIGTNKTGVLKPNSDGYYNLVLGGFNVYNSASAYYPVEPARELFEESGSLKRRIAGGNLRSELGHPKRLPGMSDRDYMARIMDIWETNVCAHIAEVTLIEGVKDKQGRPTVCTMGMVKPSGPHADVLASSLENPKENVCFSIRSFTHDEFVRGVRIKNVRMIITWDYVNEPGIAYANKYDNPTLEALEEMSVNRQLIRKVAETQEKNRSMGLENGLSVHAVDLEKAFGWSTGKVSAKVPSIQW